MMSIYGTGLPRGSKRNSRSKREYCQPVSQTSYIVNTLGTPRDADLGSYKLRHCSVFRKSQSYTANMATPF